MNKYKYKYMNTHFLALSSKEIRNNNAPNLGTRNECSLDKRWILGLGQGNYEMILLSYIVLEVRKYPRNGRDYQKHTETNLKGFSDVKSGTI